MENLFIDFLEQNSSKINKKYKNISSPINYEEAVRMILDIGAQIEIAEDNNKGLIKINLEDIKITNTERFILHIKDDDYFDIRNGKLLISKPFKYDEGMAPELNEIKSLPLKVNPNVAYYSLCNLILELLGIDNNIERLYSTKLYWLMKRVLIEEAEERKFIYI